MKVHRLQTTDPLWVSHLQGVRHDFYHMPRYLELCEQFEKCKAQSVLFEDGENSLFVPLLLRPLPMQFESSEFFDACSPYGYPCPLFNLAPGGGLEEANRLTRAFQNYCQEQNIVSFFSRLHPLIDFPDDYYAEFGKIISHGPTVYVDLSLTVEQLERQVRKQIRSVVRQALQKGFRMEIAGRESIPVFCTLYHATMKRLRASDFYYFSSEYFEALYDALDGGMKLFVIKDDSGRIVCASLVGCCGDTVQMHLMGSDETCQNPSPNKLLYYSVILWAKENGFRYDHLGGGFGAQEDSLFHFKKGFSPLTAIFKTWRCISLPKVYEDLCRKAAVESPAPNLYFPEYRSLS